MIEVGVGKPARWEMRWKALGLGWEGHGRTQGQERQLGAEAPPSPFVSVTTPFLTSNVTARRII